MTNPSGCEFRDEKNLGQYLQCPPPQGPRLLEGLLTYNSHQRTSGLPGGGREQGEWQTASVCFHVEVTYVISIHV